MISFRVALLVRGQQLYLTSNVIIEDMNMLYKTHEPITDKGVSSDQQSIRLETYGHIPNHLYGSFIRTGPGKYEFGNSSYDHVFDPIGVLQKMSFSNGKITYTSQFINCDHYEANQQAGKIVRAELGTYAEDDWVTMNEDGSLIEDSSQGAGFINY